jgi:hypothetical protein
MTEMSGKAKIEHVLWHDYFMLTGKSGAAEIVAAYAEDYITELAGSGAAIKELRLRLKNFVAQNGWKAYAKERGITGYNSFGSWRGKPEQNGTGEQADGRKI